MLFIEVLCREVWYASLVGQALIDSKAKRSRLTRCVSAVYRSKKVAILTIASRVLDIKTNVEPGGSDV